MEERATPACAAGATPIGERFFLVAILLYALLAVALVMRLAQVFAIPDVQHHGLGRMTAAGWPAHGAW